MNKKTILGVIVLLAVAVGIWFWQGGSEARAKKSQEEAAVRQLIADFGGKLKMVSLMAPPEDIAKAVQDNYSGLVAQDVLKTWQADTEQAPGRPVSSPWPERIEIAELEQTSETSYEASGTVIEATSTGTSTGSAVKVTVGRENDKWVITKVETVFE
jgi:hypothetical protein